MIINSKDTKDPVLEVIVVGRKWLLSPDYHCFLIDVFYAAASRSALIPAKMWSIAVHPATESSTYTSERATS